RQMTLAPGLRLAAEVSDPMEHYRRDEKFGLLPLPFMEDRALWRDSSSLFQLNHKGYKPVQALSWAAELVYEGFLEMKKTRRFIALGMSKKQAKVNFYRAEQIPLPSRFLIEPELVETLEKVLQLTETAARQLWGATRTLATFLISPEADSESGRQPKREDLDALMNQWAIERHYWSSLEIPFQQVIATIPNEIDTVLAQWQQLVVQTTWNALDHLLSQIEATPRGFKAAVQARNQLAAGLVKAGIVEAKSK
ncbi:MAG: type I-E CRISPR-associated protein Cse1/CasA, partial [Anaerolineales bacterium]|nr:type I-E CRISPR-associated protein Cse1/CasA [Anaerolineales bacterium]